MKDTTRQVLLKLISKNDLPLSYVTKIFDAYTSLEISNMKDLEQDHSEIFDFVSKHIECFRECDQIEALVEARHRTNELKMFSNKNYITFRKTQENFAEEIERIVGFDKSTKILEVGSGYIPYSSMILGLDGYDISSMDNFFVPAEFLKRFNVKSHRKLFNSVTKVKDYDIVVGRRPCSAILPLVKSCTESKVPYFVRLCGCELPSKSVYGWRHILDKVDKDIQFNGAYAYNFSNAGFEKPRRITEIIEIDDDRIMF